MTEPLSEQERRELADQHRGEVVEGSAEEIEPRRVPQMVSLRLDGEILAILRDIATERGISMSDLLREGVDYVIEAWRGGRHVAHLSYVSSATGRTFAGEFNVVFDSVAGSGYEPIWDRSNARPGIPA